ncbi:hypothetical protein [Nocardia sp. NRRL S-836]|uniref:hypothetical protein n=1 Tax=Nocardia sp. NRRL S-836 TaxID=1519492 RepID=UPI0006AFA906|nr:hypothetical protein [Nocardia sp. NRRL S-836]KOV84749.1 hypothetical protein ADL03_15915 [Nocardia sp. NRRL S-836]
MVASFAPLFTWTTGVGEFGMVLLAGERDGKPYSDAYVSRYVGAKRAAFAVLNLSPDSAYDSFDHWRYRVTGWRPTGDTPAQQKYPVAGCGHLHVPDTGAVRSVLPTDDDGRTLCLPCGDDRARAAMSALKPGERMNAYLATGDDARGLVTTGHGGLLGFATRFTSAPMATPTGGTYTRHYYQVRDLAGQPWAAFGAGAGMALTLMRLKDKSAA